MGLIPQYREFGMEYQTVTWRGDLKRGLRYLKMYQSIGLDAKIRYARKMIEFALGHSKRPLVAWSGGKDSTVLLHLVRQYKPSVDIVFNDTKVEFPETLKFVKFLSREWNLNLHIAKPVRGKDFWWCVEKFGWPLFGKHNALHIASVRRGGKSGEISDDMLRVAKTDVPIHSRCCYHLKEKPSQIVEKRLGCDVKFLGTTAEESRRRKFNWVDWGDHFWSKTDNLWKAMPLSIWTESDIWAYHERFDIPYCNLYDMGHTRNGCWPCTMDIRFKDNHLSKLRLSHPKLWRFLVVNKGLGKELVKCKLALDDGQYNMFAQTWDIEKLLEQRPCFFDSV